MNGETVRGTTVSRRLASAIQELRALQEPLISGDVDPLVLSDFRDALNRLRNTAWAAQQSTAAPMLDQGPAGVAAFLASERIRAAYQLCRSIQDDVSKAEVQLQKGQLTEFYGVAKRLVEDLKDKL